MLKVAGGAGGTTGSLTYAGTWNASTNTPTLTSSVGTLNNYYVVSVAGATNLNGITSWQVGDWAIFNGTIWERINGGAYGTVSNVATGTGLTGGPITTVGTVSLANTAVTAGSYGNASTVGSFTVNAQGQLTNAANTTISIAPSQINAAIPNSQLANSSVTLGNTTVSLGSTQNTFGNVVLQNANITSVAATFPNGYLSNSSVTLGNTTIALGGSASTIGNLTLQNVTVSTGTVNVQTTNLTSTTTANATFATSSLLLVPAGYIQIDLNGTVVKVPYYAV